MHLSKPIGIAVVGALTLSLAACSDDTTPSTTPTTASASPTATAKSLSVKAVDYGYVLDQQTVPAGLTKITFTNEGQEAHMMAVAGIKPGKTLADVLAAVKTEAREDDEASTDFAAGVQGAPGMIPPGATQSTYTTLKAGSYALLCFVPVQAASATKGQPHVNAGMVAGLTVSALTSTDVAPETDGEITLNDKTFTFPAGFTGKGTYKVTNSGKEGHALYIAKTTKAGLAAVDAKIGKFFGSDPSIKAETDVYPFLGGGIDVLAPGGVGYIEFDLAPGTYTVTCPEGEDGADSHVARAGEQVEFTVT